MTLYLSNSLTLLHTSQHVSTCSNCAIQTYIMDKGSGLQTGTRRSERQHLSESPVWQAPPALWDNLSKISVTKRALKELNRRDKEIGGNSLYSRTRPPLSREFPTVWKRDHCSASDILGSCTAKALRDIGQLARHGGPDNSDLRGVCTAISDWLAFS